MEGWIPGPALPMLTVMATFRPHPMGLTIVRSMLGVPTAVTVPPGLGYDIDGDGTSPPPAMASLILRRMPVSLARHCCVIFRPPPPPGARRRRGELPARAAVSPAYQRRRRSAASVLAARVCTAVGAVSLVSPRRHGCLPSPPLPTVK